MKRGVLSVMVITVMGFGLIACSSSSSNSNSNSSSGATTTEAPTTTAEAIAAPGTGASTKACMDNITVDKALASAGGDPTKTLAGLKANQTTIDAIGTEITADSGIQSEVQALVAAADQAISSNDATALNTPAAQAGGAALDTYCGTDGNGNPLPSDFAAGKTTDACTQFNTINNALSAAQTPADSVTAIKANTAAITAFTGDISSMPTALQTDAQALVTLVNTAASSGDGTAVANPTPAVIASINNVSLYCGINH
jgi:hypothetical protein